jgi:hypothetical protein
MLSYYEAVLNVNFFKTHLSNVAKLFTYKNKTKQNKTKKTPKNVNKKFKHPHNLDLSVKQSS